MEITQEYWNELAKQMILISSLLSGFSITVMTSLLVSDKNDKLTNRILKTATLSAGCFLVTLFSMVQVSMMTTPGFPDNIVSDDLIVPRTIGIITLIIGLFSLTVIISLSGWTKSRKVGIFTTIIGILTLILTFMTMIRVST